MTARVRIGVVGAGSFGRQHLLAVANSDEFELVAVADPDEVSLAAAAAFGSQLELYTSVDGLFAQEPLDAVIIATPSRSHAELAVRAVDAGLAVLLEKPIAVDHKGLSQLTALRGRGTVVPAHILRADPSYGRVRAAVGDSPVAAVVSRRVRSVDHVARFTSESPTLLTMIHDIDLAIWLTRAVPVEVSAVTRSLRGAHVDFVNAAIVDDRGGRWNLTTAWTAAEPPPRDALEVYTRDGLIEGNGDAFDLATAAASQLASFAATVLNGEPPRVTLDEALLGVATALAIERSAATEGAPVRVAHPRSVN